MLPELLQEISNTLNIHCGCSVNITGTQPLGGGSINHAYRISTTQGSFFVKHNDKDKYPGMFEVEAKGLALLEKSNSLRVPKIIGVGENGNDSFLVLEFLERGKPIKNFWEDFGSRLAAMHRQTGNFGLDHDNYIGSLFQGNRTRDNFITFFIEERLQPQLELALVHHVGMHELVPHFEQLYKRLPEIIPQEPASLLHGDLWSGNFLIGPNGEPCLIDPAVYYGHREADLAMSKLFGGFDAEFYIAYNESYPLTPGWKERIDIFNLYPLLVHVNLFGGGYVQSVKSIVAKFS